MVVILEERFLAKADKTFCSIHKLKPMAIENTFQLSLALCKSPAALSDLNPDYLNKICLFELPPVFAEG